MPLLTDFEALEQNNNYVNVCRNRTKGCFVNDKLFNLHVPARFPGTYTLFLEPMCSEASIKGLFDPGSVASRLVEEGVATDLVALGWVYRKVIEVSYINKDQYPQREVAHLLALAFQHPDLNEFEKYDLTH